MQTLWQDVRYSGRSLRKNPGFTCVVVLTLALGMGVNTSIFSMVNAVLLRPLPYPDSDRLVQIFKERKDTWQTKAHRSELLGDQEIRAWLNHPDLPVRFAAYGDYQANLSGETEAQRVSCLGATSSLLPLLGVQTALGRNFAPEEDKPGAPPVCVLGDGFWKRRFGADQQVLGQSLRLDQRSFTVVGVLKPGAVLPDQPDLVIPLAQSQELARLKKTGVSAKGIARLKPGANLNQAQVELDRAYQSVRDAREEGCILVSGFQAHLVSRVRASLLLFSGAVGCVLLIACANVANLLLARASGRQREISIRSALGAGRCRIARQLLTESVLLALLGGAAGLILAFWTNRLLHSFTATLPLAAAPRLDWRVLGFSFAVAIITGLGFGLAPTLTLWRVSLSQALNAGSRGTTASARQLRFRKLLIVGEVALALNLLVGAGLLVKSFLRLRGVDPGFRPERLLSLTVDLNRLKYSESRLQAAYFEQLIVRLRLVPGVEAIAADAMLPFSDWGLSAYLEIEGHTLPDSERPVAVGIVNPGYFEAMGSRLLRGRGLTDQDRLGAPCSVVVNHCFVRRFFPDAEPLGRRVRCWGDNWATIVGVVNDVAPGDLAAEPRPMVYHSYLQNGVGVMSLALKTAGDPMKLAAAVRSSIRELDPDQPSYSMMTMEQRLANSLAPRRLNTLLLGSLSVLALALATVGIYGVVSYLVAERTQEIGVRMALGASRTAVVALVLRRGLSMVGLGLAAGAAVSLALVRLISSQLYQVPATDPPTFALVGGILALAALLACWIPARRATNVDPVVALRME